MKPPDTSTSLLRAISADSRSARWRDFVERYRPMMFGYLKARFRDIDYDDVVQDAFVSLARVLPNYRYAPEETGAFHDYLVAVLRNKARDALKRVRKARALAESAAADPTFCNMEESAPDRLRFAVYRIALRQLLDDESILERNRRVFVEVAVNGRSPQDVAEMFGISRNNVDQIKARVLRSLQTRVAEISRLAEDGGENV